LAAGSLKVKHAGVIAGGERLLGNEFIRKIEVEVGDEHKKWLVVSAFEGGSPQNGLLAEA
jgi:hypothetical protein